MSIQWNETNREFHLRNSSISYVVAILPDGGIGVAHFGSPLAEGPAYGRLIRFEGRAASLHVEGLPVEFCPDYVPREYPTSYRGDFRASALEASSVDGAPVALDLAYVGHLVRQGKPSGGALPSTYAEDAGEAETLTVYLRDSACGVEVDLHYSIFRDFPAIARRATIRNVGARPIRITRALSAALDLPDSNWDMIQFSGAWARERRETRRHLAPGQQYVSSTRGQSSHQQNPAIILSRPDATETAGEAYGCALVYSGNFIAGADVGSHEDTRVLIGIDPTAFSWKLEPGASFETPEAVFAYTSTGLASLSRAFHDLFGRHLVRGPWRDRPRPILINNWEATYFDFDEAKLLSIAESAKALGVELFVLDDGWFGERNDDTSSLGDWDVNPKKLPEGIPGLARKIEDLGLRFGLWVEPEMVSPKSRLFSKHPDWAVGPMGGKRTLGRNQYVLDLSRPEVVEHLYGVLSRLLRSAPISYVKWDMNRNLSDPVSAALPGDRQGEFFHRYMLGLYELYGRLTADFPEVLFESCAGGGGRFDAGMLAFAPQAWASDDSDAIERLSIQWGSSFFYPTCSVGAHVSAVPNHQVGRTTPLGTRAAVAFYGAFGYELDPTRLSQEERAEIAEQIAFYKEWRAVFQFGVFHRLRGRDDADGNEVAWMTVSKDGRRAAVLRVQVNARPNPSLGRLRLRGLDPSLRYRVSVRPSTPVKGEASIRYNAGLRGGDELMAVGLLLGGDGWIGIPRGDFASWVFTLEAEGSPSA
jgi:alpha-galactosidase